MPNTKPDTKENAPKEPATANEPKPQEDQTPQPAKADVPTTVSTASEAKELVPLSCAAWFGASFALFAAVFAYLLIATWPVLNEGKTGYVDFSIFGCDVSLGCGGNPSSPDVRWIITVLFAGALGSSIHVLTSFAEYVASRQLLWSWVLWYYLRLPTGVVLAMAFYLVVRAGFFPTGSSAGPDNTTLANGPYYFAGLAALVGMFSKQTTDKLREIFEVLFSQKNPVNRADPLTSIALAISGTTPPKLTVKTPVTLIVNGHGFLASSKVTINGTVRTFEFVSEAQIKIAITADDVAKPGKLELAIQNPATPAAAAKITIEIEEKQQAPAPAAPKLQISGTDPQHLTKGTATPLTINGQGFEKNCTVTVNGEARTPTSVEDKKIVVEIQAKDVAAEGDAKIVITNPAPNGATGEIVVKVQ